jgi:hypothetical protein
MDNTPSVDVPKPKNIANIILKILLAFFILFLILVILTVASQYSKVKANKEEIDKNWPKYRCQPHVMPFAGWLVGPPNTSGVNNFVECGLLVFKNSFTRFMTPVYDFLDNLLGVIFDLIKSVENIRKMFNYLRDSMREILLDTGNLLYGYGKKISYLFNRILQTFNLMWNTFRHLFFTVAFSIYTVASLWNSPVGGVARYFTCFPASTLIKTKEGLKTIKNINVGDKVEKGGKVLGKLLLSGKGTKFYNYNNIYVSGDHLVKDMNKWVRVEDTTAKLTEIEEDIIYCLITENGYIKINDVLFADYHEIYTKKQAKKIRNMILSYLNNEKININKNADKIWGLGKDTLINVNGNYKKIQDIQINDILEEKNKVRGIIKIKTKVKKYNYKGTILTGDIIVKYKDKWTPVRCIKNIKRVDYDDVLYHLLTSTNEFNTDKLVVTDFDQTVDENINKEIDYFIERHLNNI